ncbi:bone morphogenetic protein 1 homolog [Clytia hemisphaerica]|uniref:Metalloendopeptidase n=1 Tax=Clytia hemisphaerica TaxID=252671 RepID=A0A7M5VHD8_9CNID
MHLLAIVIILLALMSQQQQGVLCLDHVNLDDDMLDAGGQGCGAAGYVLDAPIPESQLMTEHQQHRKRRAATNHEFKVWPNGVIPYSFDKAMSREGKLLILKAMRHWESETCIKFVKKTKQVDFLHIYPGNGCCSYVGRRGGRQYLSLGRGCLRFGIVTHELGHAVGFWHEQNRPDRSIYIDVLYDNVDSSKFLNFDPRGMNEVNTFDQIYDYESIMHYGTRFFSKNDGKTIRAKEVGKNVNENTIGKSYYKFDGPVLSTQDILETNLLYKCTKITDCGGTLFAVKGSFTSTNFPSRYPMDVKRDCIWIISTTQTKERNGKKTSLTLIFDQFHVGNEKNRKTGQCEDDYVEIREGKGFLSPYIVRYCGNTLPSPVTTTSGSLYVRLHTSGKNNNKKSLTQQMFTGFQADFKTDICSHHIKQFPTRIQSPDFPFAYKKGQDCLWVIESDKGMQIELDFPFFSLRELDKERGCLDYIEIHEGDGNSEKFIGRFCGTNSPKKIISSLNQIKIHFHASKKKRLGWYLGFQANIKQKDIDECALGLHSCTQACINYPGGFFCGCYSGYHTVYQKDSRIAECVDKDECAIKNGGCSHACVNTAGSFLCACPKGYTLAANKTTCIDINECQFKKQPCDHFCTNQIGSFKCSCKDGYLLQNDNKTCNELPGCLASYKTPVGRISTPNIPVTYTHDVRCTWKIEVPVHFKVALKLKVPWSNEGGDCRDSVTIHNDKYERKHRLNTQQICSQNDGVNQIVMERNAAIIDFVVKYPFPKAIEINYHSVSSKEQHCGRTFNITHGRFRTPGYPFRYPDSQSCVWTLHSPKRQRMKLRFVHFGLEAHKECQYDYVIVEEHFYNMPAVKLIGRFCGNKNPPKMIIDGGRSYFKVKFHSDETMSGKGFKAIFKEIG